MYCHPVSVILLPLQSKMLHCHPELQHFSSEFHIRSKMMHFLLCSIKSPNFSALFTLEIHWLVCSLSCIFLWIICFLFISVQRWQQFLIPAVSTHFSDLTHTRCAHIKAEAFTQALHRHEQGWLNSWFLVISLNKGC